MSEIIYQNKIKNMGESVEAFGGEMIILFGDAAPDTLKDFCYTVDVVDTNAPIEEGQILKIDENEYKILAVGEIAERNLTSLGHLTVNFSGDVSGLLPGAIVVEKKENPGLKIGTEIAIIA